MNNPTMSIGLKLLNDSLANVPVTRESALDYFVEMVNERSKEGFLTSKVIVSSHIWGIVKPDSKVNPEMTNDDKDTGNVLLVTHNLGIQLVCSQHLPDYLVLFSN